MKTIEFSIKTITPTLMGGGFGQNNGIRPSEIKGMMRYWFRAVAGSVIGDNLEALKKLENQIFGSQERKSPFRIIVEEEDIKYFDYNSPELTFDRMNGLVYLGIGNVIFKYYKDKNTKKGFFKFNDEKIFIIAPKSEFKVKFLFKNSIKEEIIELVIYSFYLATALDGFGLRTRRGFGSWQIEDVNLNNLNIDVSEELNNYTKENIEIIIDNTIKSIGEKLNTKLKFTNFIDYKLEQIITNESNWQKLLSDLGAYYRYFRVNPANNKELKLYNFQKIRRSIDYKNIWKYINELRNQNNKKNNKMPNKKNNKKLEPIVLYNPIFGLNINYKNKYFVNLISDNETLRRASPMFVSVKEINNKLAINLFISLSQYFKDEKQEVKVVFNNKLQKSLDLDVEIKYEGTYKTIVDFIDKLKLAMDGNNGNQSN